MSRCRDMPDVDGTGARTDLPYSINTTNSIMMNIGPRVRGSETLFKVWGCQLLTVFDLSITQRDAEQTSHYIPSKNIHTLKAREKSYLTLPVEEFKGVQVELWRLGVVQLARVSIFVTPPGTPDTCNFIQVI